MVTKLKTYGEMRALAVGPRGEMSRDLNTLVGNMTQKAAESRWRELGAKSVLAARSILKCIFVNLLGVAAVMANAQMLEDRLCLALGDGKHESDRRRWDERQAADARYEYCRYHDKDFEDTPPHLAQGRTRQ